MITISNYVRPQTLEEAYTLNQNKRNRIIGGMLWLKMSNEAVGTAIDLCDLGLNKIEETEDAFSIGASVTLRDIELHKGLNAYTQNAVSKAVKDIVGTQFRNMATVGGSIFGRFGFSDVLTVFLSMDTFVELYKGGTVPLSDFVTMKPDRDILVRIIVKKTPGRFNYLSMRNSRTDFPVIACAVSLVADEYRAVIGARPGRAMLITDSQGILSNGITEESARTFAGFAADNVPTDNNVRASAKYRTHLINVLVRRALSELGGNNYGD